MNKTEYQANWRAANRERSRAIVRKASQKIWFGGNREAAIQRDGEKCVSCGMTRSEHRGRYNRDITVDHIDGAGRYTLTDEKNNSLSNLQTLCLSCHGKKDRRRLKHLNTAKISEDDARNILLAKGKVKQTELANQYGLSQAAISLIWSRKNWKHIKI